MYGEFGGGIYRLDDCNRTPWFERAYNDHYSLSVFNVRRGELIRAFGRTYKVHSISRFSVEVRAEGEAEASPGNYAVPRHGFINLSETRGIELYVNELKPGQATLRLLRGKLLDERFKDVPKAREQTVKVGDKFFILDPPDDKVWFEVKEIVPTDEEKRITGWVVVKKLGKGDEGDAGEENE
ncbi:hypothetical protein [Stratiformator vulcanicus]|nr:hypothetical protein [Stratiformator vulcanicus]